MEILPAPDADIIAYIRNGYIRLPQQHFRLLHTQLRQVACQCLPGLRTEYSVQIARVKADCRGNVLDLDITVIIMMNIGNRLLHILL
ncbi:hypothetical protein D3C78_980180 [compost metagenome]